MIWNNFRFDSQHKFIFILLGGGGVGPIRLVDEHKNLHFDSK